jgi:divalent metal cation (Fe/Co/Zn/Cd) transporter
MSEHVIQLGEVIPSSLIKRGRRLEYFTIAYNSLEGLIAVVAGLFAGSIALIGFGFDSAIEVCSGAALLWRLQAQMSVRKRARLEAITLRIVGGCFLALAAYISYDSLVSLTWAETPEPSGVGIALAAISLITMPVIAREKRQVALGIGSAALSADARQTEFCAYLSAILLGGLALNALFGWWWADPLAALAMIPLILKEGFDAFRSKTCCH